MYKKIYKSLIGDLVLTSDGEALTGLYFISSSKGALLAKNVEPCDEPIFADSFSWLDKYFNGEKPNFIPKINVGNLSPFRRLVVEIIKNVPYGETVSYGEIEKKVALRLSKDKMSAQAVGGAVGANPICIIIPCHRVVGKDGNLTGYAGGIENKINLLKHENIDMKKFYLPEL